MGLARILCEGVAWGMALRKSVRHAANAMAG